MAGATKVEFDVLANDKASAKLDKIANTFLNMGRAASKVGDVGGKSMGKLTQGAGFALKGLTKLPALAAGTAVGALFISGLASAMEVQDANAKLQASLGLNKAESAKAGKIAGDLYKNAYGESVGEVSGILSTVFQSGLASVKSSETAIKGVTTQVMNFSKISNEEALPVTRAVSQMLKTGLAKNATEAFDILTRGQQLGINKSEDLLDTFNEYGTQFRKLGLDGPKALGLMNQALQAGARDSDVAADALKEFSIRAVDGSKTTIDGFKSLKLNAKDMQEQISQGGPKAAAGLDTVLDRLRAVKDPAERSRIAVELFGTQAEDLGCSAVRVRPIEGGRRPRKAQGCRAGRW
jgi:phage-related minor tail protein